IKYIAISYVLVAFANSSGANAGGEMAHLGGAASGFLYIRQLQDGRDLGLPVQWVGRLFENLSARKPKVTVTYRKTASDNYRSAEASRHVNVSTQEEIDKILDKIAENGYDNIAKEEKSKLLEFSNK